MVASLTGFLVLALNDVCLNYVYSAIRYMYKLWESIYSHTVCTHFNWSTTCKCTWFNSGDKPCSSNHSLHRKTKEKGQNNCNKRRKFLERGNIQLQELFISLYTQNDAFSGVYLSQCDSLGLGKGAPALQVGLSKYLTAKTLNLLQF